MKKALLFRLFGLGRIPSKYRIDLITEGIILLDEGVKGTVTYKNFRSPTRYANWRRQWYPASIALTRFYLHAFAYSSQIIHVSLTDERFRQMQFSLEDDGTLLVAFDASLFHNDWSGNLEYRFRTPYGQALLDGLRS